MILQILQWLESTQVSLWILESFWGFPVVVGLHILGLSVSVGILLWFDLRLLGLGIRNGHVSVLYRRLMPWALPGFAVMFVSGGLLFSAYATLAYVNVYFWIKMTGLVLAGVNAAVYHLVTERSITEWDLWSRPPLAARMAGLVSIILWTGVIVSGRMISYTMFSNFPLGF